METAIRRRKRGGKRTGHRSAGLSRGEKRRLIQLGVSLMVFALAFFGRNIFPERISQWNDLLRENTDFKSAFSQFGQAVSQGEPVLDTLGELWVEVFAGGAPRAKNEVYAQVPGLVERGRMRAVEQDDPIGVWAQENRPEPGTSGEPAGQPAQQDQLADPGAAAGQAAPASDVPTVDLQAALVAPAPPVTAVAQATDEYGQALPASVSLQEYTLGLSRSMTPVTGSITSDYGYRDHPVSGEYIFHRGVDIGSSTGTAIAAFADGVVDCVGESEESGLYIQLDHGNGVKTFYAHCSALYASKGEQVTMGQSIAAVGETGNATGPHLHFAVIKDGIYLDPLFYIQVG